MFYIVSAREALGPILIVVFIPTLSGSRVILGLVLISVPPARTGPSLGILGLGVTRG